MGKRLEQTLEDVQIAEKHVKKCPTSLVFREVQIKTTMRYHFTLTKMRLWRNWRLLVITQTRVNDNRSLGSPALQNKYSAWDLHIPTWTIFF